MAFKSSCCTRFENECLWPDESGSFPDVSALGFSEARSMKLRVALVSFVLPLALFVLPAGATITAFNFTPQSQAYNGQSVVIQVQVTNTSAGSVTGGVNFLYFSLSQSWTVPTQTAFNLQGFTNCVVTLSQSGSYVYVNVSTSNGSACSWGGGTTSFLSFNATPSFVGTVAAGSIAISLNAGLVNNVNTFSVLTVPTTTTVPVTTTTIFTTPSSVSVASDFSTGSSNIPQGIMASVPYLIGLFLASFGVRYIVRYVGKYRG